MKLEIDRKTNDARGPARRPPSGDPRDAETLLSVIVPTKNEAENVRGLVAKLASTLDGLEYEVVFVDDSTDATPRVLAGLARDQGGRLIVRHRAPEDRADGLAGAVVEGLGLARGEYVAVLDADLQHPPEVLLELLDRARSGGADIVVASRYVRGGSSSGLASPWRKLVSQLTRWGTKLLFVERLRGIQDPCSGFFVCRRALLEGVRLRPVGYKVLLEILVRADWASLEEVPYRFAGRAAGVSKADARQGWLLLVHVLRLLREVPGAGRLWKLAAVAAGGAAVVRYLAGRHRTVSHRS